MLSGQRSVGAVLAIVLLGALARPAGAAERTWTSADGLFQIQGELIEVKNDAVTLKRSDGRQITVPLEKLSRADRDFARDHANNKSKGQASEAAPAPTGPHIPPPQFDEPMIEVALPEKYTHVCTGGAGRYLIFHFKEGKKLAIFDVSEADLVHEITLPGEDVLFAAGLDKLMVLLPGQNLLHRYSLTNFQREQSVSLGDAPPVRQMLMGCNSQGPLCLWSRDSIVLYDIKTLKPLAVQGDLLRGNPMYGFGLRVSADGHTFLGWTTGLSGQRYTVMRFFGRSVASVPSPDAFSSAGHWAQPNADGSLILRHGGGMYTGAMKPIASRDFEGAVLMPTEDPRYFLAGKRPAEGQPPDLWICTTAERRPILTISDLSEITAPMQGHDWGFWNGDRRFRYLPSAKVLVALPAQHDRVVLRRLDLMQELEERGEDYLFVTSLPVTQAVARRPYQYQIEVASKAGGVNYQLESGPKGMTVSETGLAAWRSPTTAEGASANAVISIRDQSGQEIFHTLDIEIVAAAARTAATPKSSSAAPTRAPSQPTKAASPGETASAKAEAPPPDPTPEPEPAPPAFELTKDHLELAPGEYSLSPGLEGRTLLLVQGEQFTVLGADGISIERKGTLDKKYTLLKERRDYYVGASNEPHTITMIDKRTLKPTKTIRIAGCHGVTDLALHPLLPICYVAFKFDFEAPRYRFVTFNEQTGEGREDEDWIGTWLFVSPDARWIIAGYRDLWGQDWNVDELRRYSLNAAGAPDVWYDEKKDKVGGNGRGLRMSSDGKRATYLSVVGYPEFSRNLAGWDPTDLRKIPVTYPTGGKSSCEELAYHPFLPLVASRTPNGAVFFHRETGEVEETRLQLPDGETSLAGEQVERLYFSPDGRSLIFQVSINGIRYLHRAPLRLTPQESAAAGGRTGGASAARPAKTASPPAAAPNVLRTWTDSTGEYSIRAQLVEFTGGNVKLRREDATVITLPLARLSRADQAFVKKGAADGASATARSRAKAE